MTDHTPSGLPQPQTVAAPWRTSWAVLQRLRDVAKEPPTNHPNADRKPGDIWRTVLLSDLQELLSHVAPVAPKAEPTHAAVVRHVATAFQPEADTLPAAKERAGRTMADLKRAISGAIGFQWERGELQEVNADDLINVAIAVLSIKKEECNGL